ncbi:MAG TPA: 4-hydroxy-3-methylbut-2-enyl diphosphate reductase [Candidatus Enterocola sp.]|nr:4-hydroxy-3-methylbut-2-enyl diphosphate reductase [Candidatus Enterocola sp.]
MQKNVKIEIDEDSGFCFGVVTAIGKAESELNGGNELYCLGDIVHNGEEINRLAKMGLQVIGHSDLSHLKNAKVLLRAHGEPPSTYKTASDNGIKVIDATCPVVLRLQQKIRKAYEEHPDSEIVIYGKLGHAEVNGLVGQTKGTAKVVESLSDIDLIDYSKDILLFSQTTKSIDGYAALIEEIKKRKLKDTEFTAYDTICRQVSNRMERIRQFAKSHDLVLFVGGEKSSNAKVLFKVCKQENDNSFFVSSSNDVQKEWLTDNVETIGICGATSTPNWQMEEIKRKLLTII